MPNFTNELAKHLADVRASDNAHRLVRKETDQKLEALTRMVYEMHAEIGALHDRLPSDLAERVNEYMATHSIEKVSWNYALVAVLSGNDGEVCEGCGDKDCPA